MRFKRFVLAAPALTLTAGLALAQPPAYGPDPGRSDELGAYAADAGGGPFAGGSPGMAGRPRRGRFGLDPRRVAEYLQLTDAQKSSARSLFQKQRETVRPIFEQQRNLREQLESMLDDANASDASLGEIVKQIHANRRSLESAREQGKASFEALLDANQKAKLEQLETVMQGLGFDRFDKSRRGMRRYGRR
jgi:Spy/CpxP family protein refolding chaperone